MWVGASNNGSVSSSRDARASVWTRARARACAHAHIGIRAHSYLCLLSLPGLLFHTVPTLHHNCAEVDHTRAHNVQPHAHRPQFSIRLLKVIEIIRIHQPTREHLGMLLVLLFWGCVRGRMSSSNVLVRCGERADAKRPNSARRNTGPMRYGVPGLNSTHDTTLITRDKRRGRLVSRFFRRTRKEAARASERSAHFVLVTCGVAVLVCSR